MTSKPKNFIEPFAGGAIVGLTVAFEKLADEVTLVELDRDVASVWEVVLNGQGPKLANRIREFRLSPENVRQVLGGDHKSPLDRAFATLLRNRVQHGGILAPGASLMKEGENGKGLKSRWYPVTLQQRILDITRIKGRVRFCNDDGMKFLRKYGARKDVVFFIDPPYTVAGRRLYAHSEVNHDALFELAAKMAADFLMTYDDVDEIHGLAKRHRLDVERVIMKSRLHSNKTELLIGRDLAWARA